MSLEQDVKDTITEAINVPVITKIITGASEDQSGLTSDELKELAKVLPPKLKNFKQGDVIAALDNILLSPQRGLKSKKNSVQKIISDEIHNIMK